MRGKVSQADQDERGHGITPAYAGKSGNAGETDWKERDHPRLCGEKVLVMMRKLRESGSPPPMRGKADSPIMANAVKGSPPPMRGKAHSTGFDKPVTRITPAYAGKSREP